MKSEFRITNFQKAAVIFLFFSSFLLVNVLVAHEDGVFWTPGDPIVPCGGQGRCIDNVCNFDSSQACSGPESTQCPNQPACSQCELLHLGRHLIDFVLIAAAPILATFFFILAGVYLMFGSANPGMLAQGKRIFKDTFIGLLIVMMAWLITNTVLQTLLNPEELTDFTSWWQISCDQVGLSNQPPGGGASCGSITASGECNGNNLLYCNNGEVISEDCEAYGMTCGFDNITGQYSCL